MKSLRVVGIVAAAAALLSSGQAIAQSKPDTLSYKVTVKSSYGNEGTREMLMKGGSFRFQYSCAGLDTTAIKNKDGVFLISATGRQIGKYPAATMREDPMNYIPGPNGDVNAFLKAHKAKKTGAQTIAKKKCDVYSYKAPSGPGDFKLFVEPKTMTPVQLGITATLKPGKLFHRTITYVSYKRGVSIPDSKFQLPKGIPIIPMPSKAPGAATAPGN